MCHNARMPHGNPSDIIAQFDRLAEAYEAAGSEYLRQYPDGAQQAILRKIGGELEGRRVLDAGCGTGRLAIALREAGAETWGLDGSARMLAIARRNAPEGIRFTEGRMEAMPFPDAAFDFAVSRYAVHLATDLRAVYREMARVLRPGGRLTAVVLHPQWEYLHRPLPRAYGADGMGAVPLWPGGPLLPVPMHAFADYFPPEATQSFELLACEESAALPPSPAQMETAPIHLLLDWRRRG